MSSVFGSVPASRPVLVTRPEGRGEQLVRQLKDWGFVVEHHPFITLRLEHDTDLSQAVAQLAAGEFTHLVVTSRTAVAALAAYRGQGGEPAFAVPPTVHVAAVGQGTATALTEAGVEPDLVAGGSGAGLVDDMPSAPASARVLFPASSAADDTVREGLGAKGYQTRQVIAYRPKSARLQPELVTRLSRGAFGALVLTSPMIARLAADLGVHTSTPVVSIGHPTTRAAQTAGLPVRVQARRATDEDLARAVHDAITATTARR